MDREMTLQESALGLKMPQTLACGVGTAASSGQPGLTRDPSQSPVVLGTGRGYQLQLPLENHGHVGVIKALTRPAGHELLHCLQPSVS